MKFLGTLAVALMLLVPQTQAAAERGDVKIVRPASYPKVEIFTTSWCPYCVKAKQYLDSLDVPYTELDIDKSAQARERRKSYDNSTSVPLVIIGDAVIRGFSPSLFDCALGIERPD